MVARGEVLGVYIPPWLQRVLAAAAEDSQDTPTEEVTDEEVEEDKESDLESEPGGGQEQREFLPGETRKVSQEWTPSVGSHADPVELPSPPARTRYSLRDRSSGLRPPQRLMWVRDEPSKRGE